MPIPRNTFSIEKEVPKTETVPRIWTLEVELLTDWSHLGATISGGSASSKPVCDLSKCGLTRNVDLSPRSFFSDGGTAHEVVNPLIKRFLGGGRTHLPGDRTELVALSFASRVQLRAAKVHDVSVPTSVERSAPLTFFNGALGATDIIVGELAQLKGIFILDHGHGDLPRLPLLFGL